MGEKILKNRTVSIHGTKDERSVCIQISALEELMEKMIKHYLKSFSRIEYESPQILDRINKTKHALKNDLKIQNKDKENILKDRRTKDALTTNELQLDWQQTS